MDDRPSILVVDDEKVIRDMLADLLDMEGFHVRTAEDGTSALAIGGRAGEPYEVSPWEPSFAAQGLAAAGDADADAIAPLDGRAGGSGTTGQQADGQQRRCAHR